MLQSIKTFLAFIYTYLCPQFLHQEAYTSYSLDIVTSFSIWVLPMDSTAGSTWIPQTAHCGQYLDFSS